MRRRILLLTLGLTTLVVLAFAVPLAILIRSNVEQRALRGASDEATSVGLLVRSAPSDASITSYLATLADRSSRRSCVQTPSGTLLGTAPPGGLKGSGLAGSAPPPKNDGDGDNYGKPSDYDPTVSFADGVRVATLSVATSAGTYVVRTYIAASIYERSVHKWWLLLAVSSLGLLLLSVAGSELLTRRLVRPLEATADTAHRISSGDLAARAPETGPAEVAQVGTALNRLADRIDELIVEERETMADLSHRLRTPLTALRLDVDSLRDRADAERLGEHVSSLERSLTAVIRAARRPQREGLVASCDASTVVAERIAFWLPLAEDQGRAVHVDVPSVPLQVRASAEDLAVAVDALIENVIAHTPEGTDLSVVLTPAESGAVLDVGDAGPGIPATSAIRGRSDRGSSGLGLSIARRCAEQSGGTMELMTSLRGGALVRLTLGG